MEGNEPPDDDTPISSNASAIADTGEHDVLPTVFVSKEEAMLTDTEKTSEPKCALHECTKAADTFMIPCGNCKSLFHYACTRLPPYQLSLFMTKGYRKYLCTTCHGPVCSEYKEHCDPNGCRKTSMAVQTDSELNDIHREPEDELEAKCKSSQYQIGATNF